MKNSGDGHPRVEKLLRKISAMSMSVVSTMFNEISCHDNAGAYP